jgi:hypothetical protein
MKTRTIKESAKALAKGIEAGRVFTADEDLPHLGIRKGDRLVYDFTKATEGGVVVILRPTGEQLVTYLLGYERATTNGSAETRDEWMKAGNLYIVEYDGNNGKGGEPERLCYGVAHPVSHVIIHDGADRPQIVALDLGLDQPLDELVCKTLLDTARTLGAIAARIDLPAPVAGDNFRLKLVA